MKRQRKLMPRLKSFVPFTATLIHDSSFTQLLVEALLYPYVVWQLHKKVFIKLKRNAFHEIFFITQLVPKSVVFNHFDS